MNKKSAKRVKEFINVLVRDDKGRITCAQVPGHHGAQYRVTVSRVGNSIHTSCLRVDDSPIPCRGNSVTVCYHSLAVLMLAAEEAGMSAAFCDDEKDAKNLANLGGNVVKVIPHKFGRNVWMVVKKK